MGGGIMNDQAATKSAPIVPLAERLAANADGVVEHIAREYGVSPLTVLQHMPREHCKLVPSARFEEVMAALTHWGDVLLIVHTADIVLECRGRIPPGSSSRGYFNIHGDSPIGGHIKAENCATIAFVSRPFMGRRSLSIQFFNGEGEAMFKVFVARDRNRELNPEQVILFEALRGG
jgi:heme iron utilization protein